MRFSRFSWALLTLSMLFLAGCSADGKRRSLSGSVTFEGKPLESGAITFLTTTGRPGPVGGAAIHDGEFSIPADHGLAPGTYRVSISSPQSDDPGSGFGTERIPPEYNAESKQTVEVKASGDNHFDFTIDRGN